MDVKLRKTIDGMVVEKAERFKYVVGADGAHSAFLIQEISKTFLISMQAAYERAWASISLARHGLKR